MLATKVEEAKREEGFTLIELLVVVIIIGILAAIAIPVFLNQRERAWIRTAQSDVRNAAIEVETFFNDNDFTYPTGEQFTAMIDDSIHESPGIDLSYTVDDQAFCIDADHSNTDNDVDAVYKSDEGGVQQGDPADLEACA